MVLVLDLKATILLCLPALMLVLHLTVDMLRFFVYVDIICSSSVVICSMYCISSQVPLYVCPCVLVLLHLLFCFLRNDCVNIDYVENPLFHLFACLIFHPLST